MSKSIGERMRSADSLVRRRDIARAWAASWTKDHNATIRLIETALQRGSVADAGQYLGQIKALHEKKLGALPNVIDKLADDDIE